MPYNPSDKDQNDPSLPGMSLETWLEINEMRASAFAKLVPCSANYPGLIARGVQRPSYRMAKRIEELTDGAVPRTRWYPPAEQNPASGGASEADLEGYGYDND